MKIPCRSRRKIGLALMLCIAGLAASARGSEMTLTPTDRLLILAPHPDDDVLCCSGIIQKAVQDRLPVKIVFLTYGDNNAWSFTRYRRFPVFRSKAMRAMGEVRRKEAMAAALVLGVSADQLVFLGYPDYGTLNIWDAHWGPSEPFKSMLTRVHAVPYGTAFRKGAAYKGEEVLKDLESVMKDFRPTKVFAPHPADDRPDHRALYFYTQVALWDLAKDLSPAVYSYLIHFQEWPQPQGLHRDQSLGLPSFFKTQTNWETLPLTKVQVDRKYDALVNHRTQWEYSQHEMVSHVRNNELFALGNDTLGGAGDFEDYQIFADSADLVLSGHLPQKRKESTKTWVAAYGYRSDRTFERMPKIYVTFHGKSHKVYDQHQPALDANVRIERQHRQFIIRIPLRTLGQPQKVFASGGITPHHGPPAWTLWRLLEITADR